MEGSPIAGDGRSADRLAWGLVALALLLLVAGAVVSVAAGTAVNVGIEVFAWAIGLTYAAAGLLIAVRQPRNAMGWIFLGAAVATGLGWLAGSYADYWVDSGAGSEALGKTAAWYADLSWMPFIPPDHLETAAYFVASEALTNAAKHARASEVVLSAVRRNGRLVICVRDDGIGGAQAAEGSGLLGMSDRIAALGGTVNVLSPRGRGTTVTAELPCES